MGIVERMRVCHRRDFNEVWCRFGAGTLLVYRREGVLRRRGHDVRLADAGPIGLGVGGGIREGGHDRMREGEEMAVHHVATDVRRQRMIPAVAAFSQYRPGAETPLAKLLFREAPLT